jgi:hypothetical protein
LTLFLYYGIVTLFFNYRRSKMKKTLGLVASVVLLGAQGCFGMNPLLELPSNPTQLRALVRTVHAEGTAFAAAAGRVVTVPALDITQAAAADDETAADLRRGLVLMQGGASSAFLGSDGANPIAHADNAARDIGLYATLGTFLNDHAAADRVLMGGGPHVFNPAGDHGAAAVAGAEVGSILALYAAFAGAVGHVNVDVVDAAHYGFSARADNAAATTRRKADIIAGLTVAHLQAGAVAAGIDGVNVHFMALLLLVEMAEHGTAAGTQLDSGTAPLGYTPAIIAAMNAILIEIHA